MTIKEVETNIVTYFRNIERIQRYTKTWRKLEEERTELIKILINKYRQVMDTLTGKDYTYTNRTSNYTTSTVENAVVLAEYNIIKRLDDIETIINYYFEELEHIQDETQDMEIRLLIYPKDELRQLQDHYNGINVIAYSTRTRLLKRLCKYLNCY